MQAQQVAGGFALALRSFGAPASLEEAPAQILSELGRIRAEDPAVQVVVRTFVQKGERTTIVFTGGADGDHLIGAWGKNRGAKLVDILQLLEDAHNARRKQLRGAIEWRAVNGLIFLMFTGLIFFAWQINTFGPVVIKVLSVGDGFALLVFTFGVGGIIVLLIRLISWLRLPALWRIDTEAQQIDQLQRRYEPAL